MKVANAAPRASFRSSICHPALGKLKLVFGERESMTVPELDKAGLKRCDEIEEAMAQGDRSQALMHGENLREITDELDRLDPFQGKKSYLAVVGGLLITLDRGDLETAKLFLQGIRVFLAEQIPDEALAQSYEDATPKIGSA